MDNTDDTIFEVEDRLYLNPQTALNEREQFVDTLRNVQAENTAQINQNTYNLGSQVPSNIGGLGGSEGLWAAQYQTPQTDAQIANLHATAQQEALNTALTNLQNIYQNRYKQAYRRASRRTKNRSSGGTGTGGDNPLSLPDADVEEQAIQTAVLGAQEALNKQKQQQEMMDAAKAKLETAEAEREANKAQQGLLTPVGAGTSVSSITNRNR